MLDTAMRRGECCALRWCDIDFNQNRITISHSLSYTPETKVILTTPKNGKTRSVDVDAEVMDLLKQVKGEQELLGLETEFVFTQNASPLPMHPQSPAKYMKGFGKRCGVQNMHPHKLRHTVASIAITHGADVESISEKLGHHDAGFTLKQYTHANEESIKRAGDIFRNAIK